MINEQQTRAGRAFFRAWQQIEKTIEFQPEWANELGYYDNAVGAIQLEPGCMAKTYDNQNRRMIFVGTRFGTIIVNDFLSGQEEGGYYIKALPAVLTVRLLLSSQDLNGEQMEMILGNFGVMGKNIGVKIENMAKDFLV